MLCDVCWLYNIARSGVQPANMGGAKRNRIAFVVRCGGTIAEGEQKFWRLIFPILIALFHQCLQYLVQLYLPWVVALQLLPQMALLLSVFRLEQALSEKVLQATVHGFPSTPCRFLHELAHICQFLDW